jgi:hypothetical protein
MALTEHTGLRTTVSAVSKYSRSTCAGRDNRAWRYSFAGTVALTLIARAEFRIALRCCSDGLDEFGERGRDAPMTPGVNSDFVVAALEVLHERVTTHDHVGGAVAFEAAHGSEPGFQAAVVGLDPTVRILLDVMERRRDQFLDHRAQRRRAIGDDLDRLRVSTERGVEEPARRGGVASC